MLRFGKKYYNFDIEQAVVKLRQELLKKYDKDVFREIKRTTTELMCTCPFHKNGQERKPSFGINLDTGVYHCFTCGESGNFPELVSKCFGHYDDGAFGLKWINNNFSAEQYTQRPENIFKKRTSYVAPKYVSEEELDEYRYYHPYMWKRKLTPEIVTKYDIGFDKKTQCITFPVYDIAGNCVFVARRSVNTKFFNYPEAVDKPIYGLNFVYNNKILFICESVFNALTLVKWGFPAVAFLGTGSEHQYELLRKYGFRKYVLCLDGDKAGDAGIKRFYDYMHNYAKISYIKMPRDGRDVNDLARKEFLQLPEILLN